MTVMTGRPHMLTEEFEMLARMRAREIEGLRLELIDGPGALSNAEGPRRRRVLAIPATP
jgi:hypothetical protein